MPFTQEQIDALKAQAATGVRTIQYQDRSVQYQSLEEMLAAIARMEAEIDSSSTSGRSTFATHSRG